jgi:predicted GIY-YIG superfamily endonuclease
VGDGPALRVIEGEGKPYATRDWINHDLGPEASEIRRRREQAKTDARKRELERRWHTIYLLYDARDRLLYVGISANGPARLPQHAATKSWFRKVARAEFEHVKGRVAAEARELELIRERNPRWNVSGKLIEQPEPGVQVDPSMLPQDRRALEYMRAEGILVSQAQIAQVTNTSMRMAANALKRLRAHGLVEPVERGRWPLWRAVQTGATR